MTYEFEIDHDDEELNKQVDKVTKNMSNCQILALIEQLRQCNNTIDQKIQTPSSFVSFLQTEINQNFVNGDDEKSLLLVKWLKVCLDEFFLVNESDSLLII